MASPAGSLLPVLVQGLAASGSGLYSVCSVTRVCNVQRYSCPYLVIVTQMEGREKPLELSVATPWVQEWLFASYNTCTFVQISLASRLHGPT